MKNVTSPKKKNQTKFSKVLWHVVVCVRRKKGSEWYSNNHQTRKKALEEYRASRADMILGHRRMRGKVVRVLLQRSYISTMREIHLKEEE